MSSLRVLNAMLGATEKEKRSPKLRVETNCRNGAKPFPEVVPSFHDRPDLRGHGSAAALARQLKRGAQFDGSVEVAAHRRDAQLTGQPDLNAEGHERARIEAKEIGRRVALEHGKREAVSDQKLDAPCSMAFPLGRFTMRGPKNAPSAVKASTGLTCAAGLEGVAATGSGRGAPSIPRRDGSAR